MKKFSKLIAVLVAIAMICSMSTNIVFAAEYTQATFVWGVGAYDFGPAVDKVIIDFKADVLGTSFDKETFVVDSTYLSGGTLVDDFREVTRAYLSDANGKEVTASTSRYVTLDLKVVYTVMDCSGMAMGSLSNNAGPFTYNSETGYNTWTDQYRPINAVSIAAGKSITVGGTSYDQMTINGVADQNKLVYSTLDWTKSTYTWTDPSDANHTITHQIGSYEPAKLAQDDVRNPLIIWLHGAGEGGNDIDITLLGNNVTLLASDKVQGCFVTEDCAGAYVLAVQSPTVWMDLGSGQSSGESTESIYNASLFAAIENYVATHTDIDPEKIILGGCSNGGFMTMNMLIRHPDYFAAAYPICEALQNSVITDANIEAIKDIPMWFVAAQNDTTVAPANYTVATYRRLIEAGAENVYFSFPANVRATDTRISEDQIEYMGHWSWIYVLRNDLLPIVSWDGAVQNNNAGYVQIDGENVTIWEWLASWVAEEDESIGGGEGGSGEGGSGEGGSGEGGSGEGEGGSGSGEGEGGSGSGEGGSGEGEGGSGSGEGGSGEGGSGEGGSGEGGSGSGEGGSGSGEGGSGSGSGEGGSGEGVNDKKGCFGVIGSSAVGVVAILVAAAFVLRKK